ncbi:hypothetical protein L1887_12939 [Cichorium endivia]|nr:hypothetical protein L1887_12939 [Cichorium endivia]
MRGDVQECVRIGVHHLGSIRQLQKGEEEDSQRRRFAVGDHDARTEIVSSDQLLKFSPEIDCYFGGCCFVDDCSSTTVRTARLHQCTIFDLCYSSRLPVPSFLPSMPFSTIDETRLKVKKD